MTYHENDEIDLYRLYLIVKKRYKLILGMVLGAVLITGGINFLMRPVYKSSFIIKAFTFVNEKNPLISNTIISTGEVEKLISEMDLLREEKQFNELSKRLNIRDEQIKQLVKLDARSLRDAKDLVEITVTVYDRSIIPDLRNVIVQYLNQIPYVNERIAMWKDDKLHLKAEIQAKIQEIDEFKNIVIVQIKKDKAKYIGFNPLQLDEEVINLRQRLRDLENSIKLLRGFEVTIEPEIPQDPVRPKKALNLIIAGMTSLFIGIFLSFFMEWAEKNKKTKE
jgi:uncharacterized protein involved in exopolysaccharide biosynthesis